MNPGHKIFEITVDYGDDQTYTVYNEGENATIGQVHDLLAHLNCPKRRIHGQPEAKAITVRLVERSEIKL